MSQLHVKADNGDRLTLRRALSDNWSSHVFTSLEILASVVQPLAVDLQLAYRLADAPYLVPDPQPQRPRWHIQQTVPPSDLPMQTRFAQETESEYVSALTSHKLRGWLQQSTAQEADDVDYPITVSALDVLYTRVRLYSFADETRLEVLDSKREIPVSIAQESEERWIYSPIQGLLYSPIYFGFAVEYGWLRLKLFITWSPLWSNPDFPEHRQLCTALQELMKTGWTPDDIPACFRLK
ncbi:MAG: hypothetical protein AAGH78_01185 [Cyanobacteria bacterium P01_H01_bin.58]